MSNDFHPPHEERARLTSKEIAKGIVDEFDVPVVCASPDDVPGDRTGALGIGILERAGDGTAVFDDVRAEADGSGGRNEGSWGGMNSNSGFDKGGFDWFGLMKGVTQLHVESLGAVQSSTNILDVAPRYWCPTSGNQYQHPGKCPECGDTLEEVLDVAPQGVAGVTDANGRNPSGDGNVCGVRFPGAHKTSGSKVSDVADKATGTAPDTDSPMVGTGGGVPLSTSPLHKFDAPSSQERKPLFQPMHPSMVEGEPDSPKGNIGHDSLAAMETVKGRQVPDAVNESGCGASIHSGDTINRLFHAVAVCEERSRG